MRNIPEFYPKRQGRPQGVRTADLETGQSSVYHSYVFYKEEYEKVEALLEKLLNEQIQQLEKLLIEAKQVKLHLAGMSGEDISEADVDTDE